MRWPQVPGILLVLLVLGCATLPEIKQAPVGKDQAYLENERVMQQYQELMSNIAARHQQWYRYVRTRLNLNLALLWAATNPVLPDVPEMEMAKDDAEFLGPEVLALVNEMRLKPLPERKGPNGEPFFLAGTGDMSHLLQNLPELIARIEQRVAKDSHVPSSLDLTAFDQYRINVEALRRINAVIAQYLDADETVPRSDIQALAEAFRAARR